MQRQIKGALAATVALAVMLGGGTRSQNGSTKKHCQARRSRQARCHSGPVSRTARAGVRVYAPDPNPNAYTEIADIASFRLRAGYDYVYYCYSPVSATGPRLRASLITADPSLAGGTLPTTVNAFRTYVTTQANVELYNSTLTPQDPQ